MSDFWYLLDNLADDLALEDDNLQWQVNEGFITAQDAVLLCEFIQDWNNFAHKLIPDELPEAILDHPEWPAFSQKAKRLLDDIFPEYRSSFPYQ